MRLYPDKWCVYSHSVDGEVIYIGSGRPWRAFDFRRRKGLTTEPRSDEWHAVTVNGFDVEIISWHDSAEEARTTEKALIRKLKPRCNKNHTGRQISSYDKRREHLFGNSHRTGKPHSDEARRKMSEAQKQAWERNPGRRGHAPVAVRVIELDTVFPSVTAAARGFDRSVSRVMTCMQKGWKLNGLWTLERA